MKGKSGVCGVKSTDMGGDLCCIPVWLMSFRNKARAVLYFGCAYMVLVGKVTRLGRKDLCSFSLKSVMSVRLGGLVAVVNVRIKRLIRQGYDDDSATPDHLQENSFRYKSIRQRTYAGCNRPGRWAHFSN